MQLYSSIYRFDGVLLCLPERFLVPVWVCLDFFTGAGVDLLWGFTGTILLALRLNPFAAHLDRVVRRGIQWGVGKEVKIILIYICL